ncbi:MAG TPA: dienelactone hydrolase family protein [Vicinamibacterales bacterium]|nr:dienelactone hydrolase family protein [Vicinamibacterales bacterium]
MERKTIADYDPDLLVLFDAYVHGHIDRRGFLDKATRYAVGGVTAGMLLDSLSPKFAEAQKVPKDDPRIKAEYVTFPSPAGSGTMKGYLVRPAKAAGKLPGIVVIHENRGLNPHIEDIARRLALENFIAFAPDALTPLGGYPAGGEDEARTLFGKLDQAKTNEDMVAAAGFLQKHAECTGRIGAVGFCWGGGKVNLLATRMPDLGAGVPFYGSAPPAAEVPKIKAPLLIHYAGIDNNINPSWPAFEAALKAANVKYTMHMYEGASHGFNNDTTPRYDEKAATLAWTRTLEFFNANLRK